MGALVPVNQQLPAAIRELAAKMGGAVIQELAGGVQEGFPIITYKGKVWGVRSKGEVQLNVDENGHAVPAIEVVLLRANPSLSKIYYEAAYEEGSNAPPDCFSNLGDVPDPSVQNPQARACATCPKNIWGSKITPQGKKTKACQDSRRMAASFTHTLTKDGAEAPVLLLRVPPASLAPVKEYGEKTLGARGIPYFSVSTLISFDPQSAHPQFVLKPKRVLSEDEATAVVAMREDPVTLRILAEAQDLDHQPASSTGEGELSEDNSAAEELAQRTQAAQAAQAAKQPGGTPKKPARPATDEEAGADLLAGLAHPTAAVATPAKPATKGNGKAAAPAAAKPAAKATPAKAAAAAPATAEASAGDDEMASLLDSILGD